MKSIEEAIEAVIDLEKSYSEVNNLARSHKLRKKAICSMRELKDKLISLKKEKIDKEEEENANLLLGLEMFLKSHLNELKMWENLREERYNKAWGNLVNSQNNAIDSASAHGLTEEIINKTIERLKKIEDVVFPKILFFSPGFVIVESKCSICGEKYKDCNHVKGLPYMGEICVREIEKIERIEEVSVVEKPANKLSRVLFIGKEDVKKDFMTLEKIEE